MHELFRIRDGIWQIQEAHGVYFTIIKGSERAIVMDTGYGIADNRKFTDSLLSVPYTVINSHGHPDHTLGNYQYGSVYIHPADMALYESANTAERRRAVYDRLKCQNGLEESGKETFAQQPLAEMRPLRPDSVFDLGGLTVKVIELPGHTRGTVGLLVLEERLLVAGDAFNPDMWMFAENHDTLEALEKTLGRALALPFDTYLGGHTICEVPREFLNEVRNNVRKKDIDWSSYDVILGRKTYTMRYSGRYGVSTIAISAGMAMEIAKANGRGFNTVLLHGATTDRKVGTNGSVHPPIYQSSAFAQESAEDMADIFAKKKLGFCYSRINNPTIAAFEERMTELEGGVASVACASGMAAITYSILSILRSGDEFIASAGLYGGTINLFNGFEQFNIAVRYVKPNDWQGLESAINGKTKLLFAETLGNPSLDVTDIETLAGIAHAHNLPLIVDNTMATAFLATPLKMGADVVINSTSKYINGAGNAISGVVTDGGTFPWNTGRFPQMARFLEQKEHCYITRLRADLLTNHGGCLSPQNAFLNLIGMETMGLRLERECSNALALARYLSRVPGITVNYPGLETSKSYKTAKAVLKNGFGTIITIRTGSRERAFALMRELKLPFIVSNIGDTRTLVVHPASTMALHSTCEEKEDAGVFDDLVRVSVGIENIGDLIMDFEQALQKISSFE